MCRTQRKKRSRQCRKSKRFYHIRRIDDKNRLQCVVAGGFSLFLAKERMEARPFIIPQQRRNKFKKLSCIATPKVWILA